MGGLEVLEKVEFVTGGRRNTVVSNQGLGEDENLASVGGVGHGLGVSNEGGGEDGFTRNVGVGAESLALENGTILLDRQFGSNGRNSYVTYSNGESGGERGSRSSSSNGGERHVPALAASNSLLGQVSDLEHGSARSRRGLGRGFGERSQSGEHFDIW